MSHLRRYLEQTGAVAPEQLDAALRRQQIYGGSLDTVLLELEICDPETLNELVTQACGLPIVPIELLDNGLSRPWGAVPDELVEIGWAAPLINSEEGLVAAVHPDLPNERLGELYRSCPGVVPMVTPECCLEKVAAERTNSVVPQRYAVLCAAYVSALRRRPSVSNLGMPIIPVPSTTEDTFRGVAPPPAPPAEPAPEDELDLGPDPTRRTARYKEGDEDKAAGVPDPVAVTPTPPDPEAEPEPEQVPEPGAPTVQLEETSEALATDLIPTEPKPATEPPPPPLPGEFLRPDDDLRLDREAAKPGKARVVRPPSFGASGEAADEGVPKFVPPGQASALSKDDDVVPSMPIQDGAPPVRFTARGTMIATKDQLDAESREGQLKQRMSGANTRLAQARTRDAAIDALVQAAMVVSPRVGLFRLRSRSLHGLPIPRSALPDIDGLIIEYDYGSPLAAAVAAQHWAGTTANLGLKEHIGIEEDVPCMLHRIDVAGRPVMAVYLDHGGREFLPAESNVLKDLVTQASKAFEAVLKARRAAALPPPPPPGAKPDGPAPVAPPPAFGVTEPPGWGPPPQPLQAEYSRPPPDRPTDINPGRAMRRETKVDGSPPIAQPVDDPRSQHTTVTGMPPPPPVPPPPPMAGEPDDGQSVRHPTLHGLPDAIAASPDGPRFIPPPLDEHENSGIISLASPIDQPSARGRITLDDEEDWSAQEVDDADPAERRAIDGVLAALSRGEADVDDLRSLGEAGLRGLVAQFPGPLEVLRRDLRALPPPSAHGPHIRIAIRLGPALVPYLTELFGHTDPDVRFYGAFVFQELRDPRCMEPLSRLAFDGSGDVRVIAMRVLETYARYDGFDRASAFVRSELDSGNRTRQLYAARAVGTLRDTDAIPKLIDQLSSKDRFIQEASLESLCSITGQQHGLKPHRWKSWYEEQGTRHRVEWIIDSLRHRDLPVRRWAHDELIRITGHRVAFSPLGDRKSREVAAEAWTSWWNNQGRQRMVATSQPTG